MKKITVYSKPDCVQCEFTKSFLTDLNVAYETIDVTQDEAALEHVRSLGFQSLPVVEVEGREAFSGFQPDVLEQLA